jgi:hypothetical protein
LLKKIIWSICASLKLQSPSKHSPCDCMQQSQHRSQCWKHCLKSSTEMLHPVAGGVLRSGLKFRTYTNTLNNFFLTIPRIFGFPHVFTGRWFYYSCFGCDAMYLSDGHQRFRQTCCLHLQEHVCPKRWCPFTTLHGVKSNKTVVLIPRVNRTSYFMWGFHGYPCAWSKVNTGPFHLVFVSLNLKYECKGHAKRAFDLTSCDLVNR